MHDLVGQWLGHFEYGPEYGEERIGERVQFRIIIDSFWKGAACGVRCLGVSIGLWDWSYEKLNAIQVENSDVITYHDYEEPQWHLRVIQMLKSTGRPLICTEYMARTRNSRFSNVLPLLKKENVGAINWGFVSGKTNTIYAWDTPMPDAGEPIEWFHDIFYKNGTPYRKDEVNLIKNINSK